MVDPKDDLVEFLRGNVDGTAFSVPFDNAEDIVHADYEGTREYPEIAVVSKDSITPGGGQTGATGIDPTGAGAIQDTIYLIQVDCWGGVEDEDPYPGLDTHPDIVAVELGEEVARVCRVTPENAPEGYEWMFCHPPYEADDTDASPTSHREIVEVRMKVTYTP